MQQTSIFMFGFFLTRKVEGGIVPKEALNFDWLILFDGLVLTQKEYYNESFDVCRKVFASCGSWQQAHFSRGYISKQP